MEKKAFTYLAFLYEMHRFPINKKVFVFLILALNVVYYGNCDFGMCTKQDYQFYKERGRGVINFSFQTVVFKLSSAESQDPTSAIQGLPGHIRFNRVQTLLSLVTLFHLYTVLFGQCRLKTITVYSFLFCVTVMSITNSMLTINTSLSVIICFFPTFREIVD